MRGMAWKEKGNLDAALKDFDKGAELDPKLATLYLGRAGVWIAKKDFDRAIEAADRLCILLDSGLGDAYSRRGDTWHPKGDLDRAIDDYNEAIRLAPMRAQFYFNRGCAYADRRDFKQAIADFSEAVRLNPKYQGKPYIEPRACPHCDRRLEGGPDAPI